MATSPFLAQFFEPREPTIGAENLGTETGSRTKENGDHDVHELPAIIASIGTELQTFTREDPAPDEPPPPPPPRKPGFLEGAVL